VFHVSVYFWVDPSTTDWEKGLVKCHMSDSQCWTHLPTRPLWLQMTLYKTLTFTTIVQVLKAH